MLLSHRKYRFTDSSRPIRVIAGFIMSIYLCIALSLQSTLCIYLKLAAKFRRVIGVTKWYTDNFEFRPLVGLEGGFWTVDLLENAAILSINISRDIDQSHCSFMSRMGGKESQMEEKTSRIAHVRGL